VHYIGFSSKWDQVFSINSDKLSPPKNASNHSASNNDPNYGQYNLANSQPHSKSGGHSQRQRQSQKYEQRMSQAQMTVEAQAFEDSIGDIMKSVSTLATLHQSGGVDDYCINVVNDTILSSLNIFAVCCQDHIKKGNKTALILGKKKLADLFEAMPPSVAQQPTTIQYRAFMEAALNGQKMQNFAQRQESASEAQRKQQYFSNASAKDQQQAWTAVATNYAKNDFKLDGYLKKDTNAQLQKKHADAVKEYERNNQKYAKKKAAKFDQRKVSSLHFTESAKASKFANENNHSPNLVDVDSDGDNHELLKNAVLVYDCASDPWMIGQQNPKYLKAVYSKIGGIPCQVLEEYNAKSELTQIRLCDPLGAVKNVPRQCKLERDAAKVEKAEMEHLRFFGSKSLGYPSCQKMRGQDQLQQDLGAFDDDAYMYGNE
jgi:hypothetical protein